MELDRLSVPLVICADPDCRWAALPDREHFSRHNQPCAELFVGSDSSELLCELPAGHSGPHRGTVRRPEPPG